ncbi:transposase [Streptomyces sp. NPDC050523]|uniref:transposase n=1 Tax=Streptomyces sp. NPDC050523 TaxID=3365622 RepID=UPI003791DF58
MAPTASCSPGRTRCQGRARPDLGDRRRRVGAGEKRSLPTGPNPVDRGKRVSELHVLSEAQGIPLAIAVSGANTHDSLALKPLMRGIPAIRSRRRPRRRRPVKLCADRAYFSAEHLAWLQEWATVPRIVRSGIESGKRLGGTGGRSSGPSPGSSATAPHRPIRVQRVPFLRLPRPGRRTDLLQEAGENRHVRAQVRLRRPTAGHIGESALRHHP